MPKSAVASAVEGSRPGNAAGEVTLTIRPKRKRAMAFTACWQARKVARRFTSRTWSSVTSFNSRGVSGQSRVALTSSSGERLSFSSKRNSVRTCSGRRMSAPLESDFESCSGKFLCRFLVVYLVIVVNGEDGMALAGEPAHDGQTDAPGPASDKCSARFLSHGLWFPPVRTRAQYPSWEWAAISADVCFLGSPQAAANASRVRIGEADASTPARTPEGQNRRPRRRVAPMGRRELRVRGKTTRPLRLHHVKRHRVPFRPTRSPRRCRRGSVLGRRGSPLWQWRTGR